MGFLVHALGWHWNQAEFLEYASGFLPNPREIHVGNSSLNHNSLVRTCCSDLGPPKRWAGPHSHTWKHQRGLKTKGTRLQASELEKKWKWPLDSELPTERRCSVLRARPAYTGKLQRSMLLGAQTLTCHLLNCEEKPKLQLSAVTMADYNPEQSISSNKGPKHINSFS